MYPYIYLYLPLHTTYQLYILGGGGRVGLGYILFVAKCFCALIRLTFEAKKKRRGVKPIKSVWYLHWLRFPLRYAPRNSEPKNLLIFWKPILRLDSRYLCIENMKKSGRGSNWMSMSRTLLGLQHCNLRQSKVGMGPHHGLSLNHQDSSTYHRISTFFLSCVDRTTKLSAGWQRVYSRSGSRYREHGGWGLNALNTTYIQRIYV